MIDAANYALTYLASTSVVIIANADVFFDTSLNRLTRSCMRNRVLGLARWDCTDGHASFLPRVDSHDAWVVSPDDFEYLRHDLSHRSRYDEGNYELHGVNLNTIDASLTARKVAAPPVLTE